MKRDLPDFYVDSEHQIRNCRRGPRAKFFRRMYRTLRSAAVVVPVVIALAGFGAYVWNEHTWRQATATDKVLISTLRSQVQVLQERIAGPERVCQISNKGVETCIRIYRGI